MPPKGNLMAITVSDLAAELGLSAEDTVTALCAIGEFVLGSDSRVRESAAGQLRASPPPPRQASDEGHEFSPTEASMGGFRLPHPRSFSKKRQPVAWRPGGTPLNKVVRLLAEPYIENNGYRDRDRGVIFQDELDDARGRYREWLEAGFELHCVLEDDTIAEWIRMFPRRNLLPREVVSLVAAGFTPQELALRLWYGRLNPERLPLMDQLMRGTITAEQARADLDKYRSAG